MPRREFTSAAELDAVIQTAPAVLLYVASRGCQVCQALRPRVESLCEQTFPQLTLAVVDQEVVPSVAAQRLVLTVPTVILYVDGRESVRRSRSWSMGELASELERVLTLRFA